MFSVKAPSEEEAISELRSSIGKMKTEDGTSLADTNLIHSMGVDLSTGTVSIKLNLTKDYRQGKTLL